MPKSQTEERARPLFSVPEVAKAAGQHRSTLYRWCKAGLVKFKQPGRGRTIFIPRTEVVRVWDQDTLDALDRTAPPRRYGHAYPKPKGGGA